MLRLLYFQGTLPVGKYNGMQSVHSFQDSLEEVHQKNDVHDRFKEPYSRDVSMFNGHAVQA